MPSSYRSLAELVPANARRAPSKPVMARSTGSGWQDVTASQFSAEVTALARGFVAAGIGAGDRVGLMSRTRYEWTLVDLALWAVAAVPVPVYETSAPEQVAWVLGDSGAVGLVLEGTAHLRRLAQVRDRLPSLREVWALDPEGDQPGLAALVALGAEPGRAEALDEEIARRQTALSPDSLATIIYTSGTTGRPKGCQLTHGNFLSEVDAAVERLPELFEPADASTLLFLPLAHVFGRMIEVAVVREATHTGHSDPARITKDLVTFRPTFLLAVPRIFEKVYDTARRKAVAEGRGRVFDAAEASAVAWSRGQDFRRGPGPLVRARHAVFDRLVFGRIRAALGGRVDWAVSGGAPLGERLGHFYRGIGVTVLEGYGLTETTAALSTNSRSGQKIGTVGRPLQGVDLRFAGDGEIQVRGGMVFGRYRGDDDAGSAAFTEDGWFRTGDLGSADADGYLTITGRLKEIIVTAGGKNVSPAAVEDAVRACPVVGGCVLVGDGRPFVAALVTLDPEAVPAWLTARGRPQVPLAELVEDPDVHAEVQAALDRSNASVSSAEQVKRFVVLPTVWTEEGGQITPSLKVKRRVVLAEHVDAVEALYARRR